MHLVRLALAGVVAGTLVRPSVADAAPRAFAPVSAWEMEYAEDSCRLIRSFGDGDAVVTLALERYEPSNAFSVALISDALTAFRGTQRVKFRFDPAGPAFEYPLLRSELADGRAYYQLGAAGVVPPPPLRSDQTPEELLAQRAEPYQGAKEREYAQRITSLTVTEGFSDEVRLQLGPMEAPVGAVQTCIDELLSHWNINVDQHRTMTRKAVPAEDPYEWLDAKSFPSDQGRRGLGGTTRVRLMVDQSGKPTSCHIQRGSAAESFNQAACRILMERGKFVPALDAAGQPMASYFVASFVFAPPAIPAGSARRLR